MKLHITTAKLIVVNVIAMMLLYFFWMNSWVHYAVASDPTMIIFVIIACLGWGLALCIRRSWQIDRELANIHDADQRLRPYTETSLQMRFANRLAFIQHLAGTVVILGLVGTVVGFIIALFGISPETLASMDTMVRAITQILSGMSVAFYTTLVGMLAALWLDFNLIVLNQSLSKLYFKLVEVNVPE
jgi:hypothetical protein